MITTLYLFQFFGFYMWQLTSKQAKHKQTTGYFAIVMQNSNSSRWVGSILLTATGVLFVSTLGLMSGICAFFIGLMGVGCLSVALAPFEYLHYSTVAVLYISALALEIFV